MCVCFMRGNTLTFHSLLGSLPFEKIFIYLAGPGLNCSMQDLWSAQSLSHWTTREAPLPTFEEENFIVQVSSGWLCPADLSRRMGEEKGTSQERQGRGCWRGRDGRGWSRSPGAKSVQLELWENVWGTRNKDVCAVCRGWEGGREDKQREEKEC